MTTTRTATRRPKSRQVAILQSNYIPWKGYFDLIDRVDEFFLYDEVQYTRGDWRNRNRVKTPDGLKWLTIPVEYSGHELRAIHDVRVVDGRWARKHWTTLANCYARAPHFRPTRAVEALYDWRRTRIGSPASTGSFSTASASSSASPPSSGRPPSTSWGRAGRPGWWSCAGRSGPRATSPAGGQGLHRRPAVRRRRRRAGVHGLLRLFRVPAAVPPFEHGVTVLDVLFNTGPDVARLFKARR